MIFFQVGLTSDEITSGTSKTGVSSNNSFNGYFSFEKSTFLVFGSIKELYYKIKIVTVFVLSPPFISLKSNILQFWDSIQN